MKIETNKMKFIIKILLLSSLLLSASCASGLNNNQKRKLIAVKNEFHELYEEEKDPVLAVALGLLPGGGSFYTRSYGTGAVSLLLWPLSVLWDPINGLNASQEINYYATTRSLKRAKKKELKKIKSEYSEKKISEQQFNIQKMDIDEKYDLDNLL